MQLLNYYPQETMNAGQGGGQRQQPEYSVGDRNDSQVIQGQQCDRNGNTNGFSLALGQNNLLQRQLSGQSGGQVMSNASSTQAPGNQYLLNYVQDIQDQALRVSHFIGV